MLNEDVTNMGEGMLECNPDQVDDYKIKVDELFMKVDKVSI